MGDEYVDRMVRRRIALDALRRLRRLVDAERVRDAGNARWARRIALASGLFAAGVVLQLFLH